MNPFTISLGPRPSWATWLSLGTLFPLAAMLGCAGGTWKVTGEVEPVAFGKSGYARRKAEPPKEPVLITEADTFTIRLDSVFVREAAELGGAEFLVYAEIYDVQPDDRVRLLRVLFHESNQAGGSLINQRDRLVFGPIAYTGHPVRVRLFVVELDKGDNDVIRDIVKQAAKLGASLVPGLASATDAATSVGDLFLSLDEDERELAIDFTLYPHTHSQGPYLETGTRAFIKTENAARYDSDRRLAEGGTSSLDPGQEVRDDRGQLITIKHEDYTQLFEYSDDPNHPLAGRDGLTTITALRIADGQLWLETVGFENAETQRLILASEHYTPDHKPLNATGTKGALPTGFRLRALNPAVPDSPTLINDQTGAWFWLGRRLQYREKTHAVISVARGGQPVARSVFEEMSEQQSKTLQDALQSGSNPDDFRASLDVAADELIKLARRRDIIGTVNARFIDDTNRRSGAFPCAYLQELVDKPKDASHQQLDKDDVLSNEAIIAIVRSITRGFPHTQASVPSEIAKLKQLTPEQFAPHKTEKAPNGDGTYVFQALSATAAPAATASLSLAE